MNKYNITKEMLVEKYSNELKPMYEIAEELGASVGLIHKLIHEYDIPIHRIYPPKSVAEKERISKMHKGKVLSDETKRKISEKHKLHGPGHKKLRKTDGYIALYYPDYPRSHKDGYVMEHIYVMEQYLGRALKDDEVVHHINHIRTDNRIENLKLMTAKEHTSFHMKERHEKRRLKNAQ